MKLSEESAEALKDKVVDLLNEHGVEEYILVMAQESVTACSVDMNPKAYSKAMAALVEGACKHGNK